MSGCAAGTRCESVFTENPLFSIKFSPVRGDQKWPTNKQGSEPEGSEQTRQKHTNRLDIRQKPELLSGTGQELELTVRRGRTGSAQFA